MKLKHLFILNAFVSCLSGSRAVLMPVTMVSLFGVTPGSAVVFMAQYAGLGSIAMGLIAWFARNVKDDDAQRAITTALLITNAIGAIISVLGTLSGAMKGRGWLVTGFYLFFALGYAYFRLKKSSRSPLRAN
jgi:hypothetical protein